MKFNILPYPTVWEKLGTGAFGQVRACIEKSSGAELAIKIVYLTRKSNLIKTIMSASRFSSREKGIGERGIGLNFRDFLLADFCLEFGRKLLEMGSLGLGNHPE